MTLVILIPGVLITIAIPVSSMLTTQRIMSEVIARWELLLRLAKGKCLQEVAVGIFLIGENWVLSLVSRYECGCWAQVFSCPMSRGNEIIFGI
jgi:hypothetical protein